MTDSTSVDAILADLPKDATTARGLLEYLAANRVGQEDSFRVPDQGELLAEIIGAIVALDRRLVELELDRDDLQIRVNDLEDR